MRNIAIIFAGGTGSRMGSNDVPKQFLEVNGKPILIYTLEVFERIPEITDLVVVCLAEWIGHLHNLLMTYHINKVRTVVAGGKTAQESQFIGLNTVYQDIAPEDDTVILMHDGVRPLVDAETILKNIRCVRHQGVAITVTRAIETVITVDDDCLKHVLDRATCRMAKAPQSFYFKDIYAVHQRAIEEQKFDFIDSASMMQHYGFPLYTVDGKPENIKITTPTDYYMFKAILTAKEQES